MFVDSHCHLDRLDLEQAGGSLDSVIQSAKQCGVSHLLCVCISGENRLGILDIAERFPQVYASAGVHPSDVTEHLVSVEELCEWCCHRKVVALGESGLDYHYSASSAELQKQSFANHLLAGQQLDLPVIVHTRNAKQDTLSAIKEFGSTESSGVLHCFTESWQMAKSALDLNYYISLSGIVTFRNADDLREVAKRIPADRLLLETDSPYLAPVPYRGKSNQPKYVKDVAEYVAQLRGVDVERLAEETSDNFFRLFKQAQR